MVQEERWVLRTDESEFAVPVKKVPAGGDTTLLEAKDLQPLRDPKLSAVPPYDTKVRETEK